MNRLAVATLTSIACLAWGGNAQACLAPLPMTSEEAAAQLAQRQSQAWDEATLILEVEVGRSYSVSPAPGGPAIEPALRVELRPIRLLRGEGGVAPVEMVYPMRCGVAIAYSTEPGTRLIAWSRSLQIDDGADIFELMPTESITHTPTLAVLATP